MAYESSSRHPPTVSGVKRPAQSQNFPSRRLGSADARGSPERVTTRTWIPANVSGVPHRKRAPSPFGRPLPPLEGQRSRMIYKQSPARAVNTSHIFGPPSASRGRAVGMVASTVSAPIPVKRAQYDLPHWQADENARAHIPARQFAAMSVGNTGQSRSRDVLTKDYGVANDTIRAEYDEPRQMPKYFGRKAARKVDTPELSSDDDDADSSPSSGGWETETETDKESESDKDVDSGNESEASVEIIDFRPAPVIEILDDTPPASPALTPCLLTPPGDILVAIEELVLPLTCLQLRRRLPFLARNLRRGFLNYCRLREVPTAVEPGESSVEVCLKLADNSLAYEIHLTRYECPLCGLHSPFATKEMLEVHLTQDHDEVRTVWKYIDKSKWQLEVLLEKEPARFGLRAVAKSPSPPLVEDFQALRIVPDPLELPPPDPLGPTARFPFLPAKSEHGGPDLKYSSRFGGPKIYDLLGTLPMEPYGILRWSVEDREEEIFESDDILDEHKVMHALWARWIFFRRNFFVAHYFNGVKQFVADNWRMIQRAAGWDALRYWLLLLMTGKFLTTGREVAEILDYYTTLCSTNDR